MFLSRTFNSAALLLLSLVFLPRARAQPSEITDGGVALALPPEALVGLDAGASGLPDVVEVTVRTQSRSDELRRSAQAVTVVDTTYARRGAADLGEVLARTEGISIQRAGGLGSTARFSLAGFEGEQIRFFLDGVPLSVAGFPFGIENVPVNLLERVEIYRGVVPIRFGADALGGAVQLVTRRPSVGSHGSASYQAGSFDTHRLSLQASHLDEPSGLYAQATAYLDRSDNDYPVTAPVEDAMGRRTTARVRRFHDHYAADGALLELGVLDRSWAERLSLRVFYGRQARDLQSDLVMVQPYGETTAGILTGGSTLTYKQTFWRDATFELLANYAYSEAHIKDETRCLYDWFGRCSTMRERPGELERLAAGNPYLYGHSTLLRANLRVPFLRQHALAVALSPSAETRSGEDRAPEFPGTRDPLDVRQQLYTITAGVAYQLHALAERLEAEAFFKEYAQLVRAEQSVPLGIEQLDFNRQRLGAGSMARYRLTDWLLSKASYEYATRLPSAVELLGNGIDVGPNRELKPEVSHNLNLELALDKQAGMAGSFFLELVGFQRKARDLINRETAALFSQYNNVTDAKVLGTQGRARWSSPRNLLTIDGNLTYQDVRNESETGRTAVFRGDRIPNRPYLFGTALARLELGDVFVRRDQLWLSFLTRCTGEFDRGWASVGRNRIVVPRQVLHFIALTYLVRAYGKKNLSTTLELQNLTDARSYDFFGAQRPGRTVILKLVAEL